MTGVEEKQEKIGGGSLTSAHFSNRGREWKGVKELFKKKGGQACTGESEEGGRGGFYFRSITSRRVGGGHSLRLRKEKGDPSTQGNVATKRKVATSLTPITIQSRRKGG